MRERMQHPAILPWPPGPPVNGRAMQSARHFYRQRSRCPALTPARDSRPPPPFQRGGEGRGAQATHKSSAANPQPLDQRLVTSFIGASEIIEELATLRHKLEQSTPGMVVLDVGLEVLRQVVDALRKDR